MSIKGCIFDFNGTLIFDDELHVKAWLELADELGYKGLDAHTVKTVFNGQKNNDSIKSLVGEHDVSYYDELSRRKEALYRQEVLKMNNGPHLVEGATDLFDYLKQNHIPFTIASASIKENIDFFIDTFSLSKWIDPQTIVYDDDRHLNKADMYKEACHNLNLNPQEVIIFEDSLTGIKGAINAGCDNIIVLKKNELINIYSSFPQIKLVIDNYQDKRLYQMLNI